VAEGPGKARPASANRSTPESPAAANDATPTPASKPTTSRKGCRAALAKQRRPYCRDSLGKNLNGPTLVVLPAGKAEIGGSKPAEQPKYTVTIKRPFGLSVFEVRNAEFNAFCLGTKRTCPAPPWSDPDFPVVNVSWSLATKYTEWLSDMSGAKYRLPTESEWEYAARAGTSSTYFWGDEVGENQANCVNCQVSYNGKPAPVGSFSANPWGLYDVHGNVWEWTKDCIDANSAPPANGAPQLFGNCDSRELRGGSAESDAWSIRGDTRAFAPRKMVADDVGFRVAMEIPQEPL